jgi:hypothetical protein
MFFNIVSKIESEHNYFKFWKEWLIFGLLMLMLYLTRSVGIAMLISVVFYFFISKKHKAILFTVLPFVMFYFIFFIYKVVFWKTTSVGIESQSAVFYLKDPYNASAGNEDLTGYFFRFISNIYQYLYEHFFAMNGINVGHISKLNVFFAIIFLILLINAFVVFMKSNKLFYIIGIYLLTALGITFITVQTFWNQERLIMVYYPFLVIILFYALDKSMSKRKSLILKILPFVIGCIVLLLVLINSLKETSKTVPVLAKNVSGNTYYGYTRGWDSYLKLSEWCGNNLKTSDIVGCRNPTMSFIYSKDKEYRGIYGFPAMSVDSFLYSVNKFSKVIIIDLDELLLDKIKDDEKQYLRKNIWGLMMCKKRRVGVIQADSTNTGTLMEIINKYDLSYTNDISNLSNLTTYGYVNAVIPDNLVEMLKKQKLDYLLDGTIGFVENNKEHYVNTIFRIIFFINQKYPDLFEVIRNEGKDYPATLYKIHWEKI